MKKTKKYEFEWYIFVNNEVVAGFNNKNDALKFFDTLDDGAILQNRIWL